MQTALRRGVHENQPGALVLPSILPQGGAGWLGPAALTLLGPDGRALPPLALAAAAALDARRARFVWRSMDNALTLTSDWSIMDSGVIAVDSALANDGALPVGIAQMAALALPLPRWADALIRWPGRWSQDAQIQRQRLRPGQVGATSRGGRAGFDGAHWAVVDDGAASETHGRLLAVHLAWCGDAGLVAETDSDGDTMLMLSPVLEPGEGVLVPGARWAAPRALMAVSGEGWAGLRARWHDHVRAACPPMLAQPRRVHLNSWEACGFAMDADRLMRLADDAAALGVERFVLDDGWFGARRGDRAGLGDWQVAPDVLPDGLAPLIAHVRGLGMDFGLWVEPEMISADSDVYRAHPDWCLHDDAVAAGRPEQRHQLVLDLTRADAFAHVLGALDALLTDHSIAYLKWDHNRPLFPRAGRGHAQALALLRLLDTLRTRHPAVEIESCASGGGRIDLAMLARCTRVWPSDNNDALARFPVMQAWAQMLPLGVLGNHVGPDPNPITGRRQAMDFRAKCAMFGHMGVEADPARMREDDRAVLAAHIALYKDWRDVIHGGRLYAITHPDPGVTGWLARGDGRALALVVQTAPAAGFHPAPVTFAGLDDDARYRLWLPAPWPVPARHYLAQPQLWHDGIVLSGRALRCAGIALPLHLPETAWLVALQRVEDAP